MTILQEIVPTAEKRTRATTVNAEYGSQGTNSFVD